MLMTIGMILLLLWIIGLVTGFTLGGFIHILLLAPVLLLLLKEILDRGIV
jgi:hypothetical protein